MTVLDVMSYAGFRFGFQKLRYPPFQKRRCLLNELKFVYLIFISTFYLCKANLRNKVYCYYEQFIYLLFRNFNFFFTFFFFQEF